MSGTIFIILEIFTSNLKYSCPEGWITSPHGCFFFAIDIEPKTWEESVEYCEELGGHLAEVKNDEIQTVLVEEATALGSSTNWWLGATDKELVSFSVVINFALQRVPSIHGFWKIVLRKIRISDTFGNPLQTQKSPLACT